MILKGFKEKSNQKFINKLVSSRSAQISSKKIESVGIVLNMGEYDDFESFRIFFEELKLNPNKIKIIGFVEDPKLLELSRELLFSEKHLHYENDQKIPAFNVE